MHCNKSVAILLVIFIINKNADCQIRQVIETIKPSKAFEGTPILKKKSQVLQIGVGAPNNVASLLNVSSLLGGFGSSFGLSSSTNAKAGPFYLDYEYFIKDNIGLGIGFSYASASETTTIPFSTKTAKANLAGASILLSTSYHFYTTDKLDSYSKASIGATLWKGSYIYDDGTEAGSQVLPTPIAYKALVGLRYFVSSNIAPYGECSFSNLKFSACLGIAVKLQ